MDIKNKDGFPPIDDKELEKVSGGANLEEIVKEELKGYLEPDPIEIDKWCPNGMGRSRKGALGSIRN